MRSGWLRRLDAPERRKRLRQGGRNCHRPSRQQSFGQTPSHKKKGGERQHPSRNNAFLLTRNEDRKSTRLNSSHLGISYAVFCLKKKNTGPPFGRERASNAYTRHGP